MLGFKNTFNDSDVFEDNQRYTHYHTPSQLIKYYANYFEYKVMPDLKTFQLDEAYQTRFHSERGQHHGLFMFPDNEEIPEDIVQYAINMGYGLEKMELYELVKKPKDRAIDEVVCQRIVTEDDVFLDFLEVCREGEIQYGEDFVTLKDQLHRRDLEDPRKIQMVAYIHGFPAGKIEAIIGENTIEIDDFFVDETYRNQGVGTKLQQSIWQMADGKRIILIADGNDSPREMYQRQGYELVCERYELLKKPE